MALPPAASFSRSVSSWALRGPRVQHSALSSACPCSSPFPAHPVGVPKSQGLREKPCGRSGKRRVRSNPPARGSIQRCVVKLSTLVLSVKTPGGTTKQSKDKALLSTALTSFQAGASPLFFSRLCKWTANPLSRPLKIHWIVCPAGIASMYSIYFKKSS